MDEILNYVEIVIESGELIEYFDRGVEATLLAIAEVADDLIAAYVPAYAAARAACGSVPLCIEELVAIRNSLFLDIARVTGLRALVSALIDAWKAIPASLRSSAEALATTVAMASDAVTTFKEVVSDPSKAWEVFTAEGSPFNVSNVISNPNVVLGAKALLDEWFEAGLSAVLGPLEDIPVLNDFASGLITVSDAVTGLGGDLLAAVDDIPVVGDVIGGVGDVGENLIGGVGDLLDI